MSPAPSRIAVPDIPAPIREINLLAGENLRPTLAWISERDLLATALVAPDSKFWDTRVVRIDSKTGDMQDVLPQGSVLCASPTERVAGLLVGSKAGMFTSDKSSPQPEARLHEWSRLARTLQPVQKASEVNPWICRHTRAEHRNGPMLGRNADVVYLEARHGLLQLEPDLQTYRSVHLVKNGRSMPVALKLKELPDAPQYLPFRDTYLIAAGSTLAEAFYRDEQGEAQQESPIVTMTPAGKVQRENYRGPLSRLGLVVDAQLRPYAKGVLVISHGWRKHGGGIYTLSGNQLRRAWCVGQGEERERLCRIEEAALSPDGCRLAFYARGSDDPQTPYRYEATLKVMELCAAGK